MGNGGATGSNRPRRETPAQEMAFFDELPACLRLELAGAHLDWPAGDCLAFLRVRGWPAERVIRSIRQYEGRA